MSYRLASLLLTCAAAAGLSVASSRAQAPAPPAPGQLSDSNSQGVAAIVNDYVISDYDVDQRVALFITTAGIAQPNKEGLEQIKGQVLRALEDETLELQEASKHKITVKKDDVDKAIQSVATDNNLTLDQITVTLRRAGVSMETFRNQLAAQLAWNKLVEARYAGAVTITDAQVDAALDRLKAGGTKPQFQVAEVFLGLDRPEDDAKVHQDADQIVQQLNMGAIFPTVARQFSQAPSAAGGGNIGWVQQGQLPDEIDKALIGMQPGQIAGPIKSEGGYYVLMMIDRREPIGTKAEEAPKLDPAGPIPLDRFLLPLPPDATAELAQQAVTAAETLRTHIRACSDLPSLEKQVQGSQYFHLGPMKLTDLSMELADAVRKTPPGGVTAPVVSEAGVELIVRCDLAVRTVTPMVIPSRDDLTQQLFVQQITVLARSYLRDLRRDAVVETR